MMTFNFFGFRCLRVMVDEKFSQISNVWGAPNLNLWGGAHRPAGSVWIFGESRFALGTRRGGITYRRMRKLWFSNVSERASHDRYQELCKRISSDEIIVGRNVRLFGKIKDPGRIWGCQMLWEGYCPNPCFPGFEPTKKVSTILCTSFHRSYRARGGWHSKVYK